MKVIKEMKKLLILSALFFPLNIFGEWVIQTSDIDRTLNDVCFVDTLHGWIAAGSEDNKGVILRTTNGGRNWGKIYVNPIYSTENLVLTTIGFVNSLDGWVGGYEHWQDMGPGPGGTDYRPVFLHSVDGGNNWGSKQSIDSPAEKWEYGGRKVVDICIVDSTYGFYMTQRSNISNGGNTFMAEISSLDGANGWGYWCGLEHIVSGMGICFIDSLRGWFLIWDYGGYSDNGCIPLFYTEKGIESLSIIYEFPDPYTLHLIDIDFVNALHGWIVGDSGRIFHTVDGGTTWVEQASGITSSFYAVDFLDSLNGWVAGDNGTILRTRDGGNNWIKESTPTSSKITSLCVIDTSNIWAVGDDGVILCSNSNFGVEEVTPNFDENLLKIQPNPCFSSTDIKYRVPQKSGVKLRIYNLSGQLIKVLVNEHKPSGSYSITYKPSQAGIYFCQIEVNKVIETKKLTFVR